VFIATMAGGMIFAYIKLNRMDYDHSHAGVERHRIDKAADVRETELSYDYKLRKLAVEAQIKLLMDGSTYDSE
jgi:hypothetical protein